MTSVGLVGGIGPESTIDYYRRILEAWEREAPGESPSIVIDSLDVRLGLRLVEKDRPAVIEYMAASVERLAAAGVDFIGKAGRREGGKAREGMTRSVNQRGFRSAE